MAGHPCVCGEQAVCADAQSSLATRSRRSECGLCREPVCARTNAATRTRPPARPGRNSYLLYIRSGNGARPDLHPGPQRRDSRVPGGAGTETSNVDERRARPRSSRLWSLSRYCGDVAPNRAATSRHSRPRAAARGAWLRSVPGDTGSRVIPACAGNSARRHRIHLGGPGHPCVCGEQASPRTGTSAPTGSSLSCRTVTFGEVIEGLLASISGDSPMSAARFPKSAPGSHHRCLLIGPWPRSRHCAGRSVLQRLGPATAACSELHDRASSGLANRWRPRFC